MAFRMEKIRGFTVAINHFYLLLLKELAQAKKEDDQQSLLSIRQLLCLGEVEFEELLTAASDFNSIEDHECLMMAQGVVASACSLLPSPDLPKFIPIKHSVDLVPVEMLEQSHAVVIRLASHTGRAS